MSYSNSILKHKTFSALLFFLSLSFLISLQKVKAQNNFEGEITFQIKPKGQPTQTMAYFVKGKKVRMEVTTKQTSGMQGPVMLFDNNTNTMYTIIKQAKSYMEIPINLNEQMDSTADDNKDMRPYKTGKTAKIAGVECEEWKTKTEDGVTDIWNAKGFGNFMFAQNKDFLNRRNGKSAWARELMKEGFFPFKIINYDKDGNIEMEMEVTNVMRKTLSPSMFEIPSGYQKINLPGRE